MWKKVCRWWQRFSRASGLAEVKEVLREERAQREAMPSQVERFLKGAPMDDIKWSPANSMQVGAAFFTSESYLRTYERADWRWIDPRIETFAARLVEAARRRNVPLYVHTAWRSPDEQTRLVNKGRSQTRPPVAAHCQGAAVDIVHALHHWEMSRSEWQLIGNLGFAVARQMGLKLQWGGEWSYYDPAHWEIKGWAENMRADMAELNRVQNGYPVRKCPRAILKLGPRN